MSWDDILYNFWSWSEVAEQQRQNIWFTWGLIPTHPVNILYARSRNTWRKSTTFGRALTDSFHESVMCLYGSTSYGHITHETLYWTVSCLIESVCIFVSAEQILCHRASKCAAPISNELTNLRWCNCSPISDELRYTMLYKNNPRWRLTRNWRKLLFVVY